MIPSLGTEFDAWAADLATAKPVQHRRLLEDWRRLLADRSLSASHQNPLYICRQRLLAVARTMGFAGSTK